MQECISKLQRVIYQKTEDMIKTPHLIKRVQISSCLLKINIKDDSGLDHIDTYTVIASTIKHSNNVLWLKYTAETVKDADINKN